ncbi:MAG TPA: translation initiation factor IF-2, partial [Proteobacteria bacterium]|nr:translation initiation factor IF-2 [Pseudomonadota bacterium]
AEVPIIVAINKMDKSNANPEAVEKQLADKGLVPEQWGGDTLYARVSAKQGEGIEELLDLILLQAEVLELKANPKKRGKGYILESRMEKGRGPVAVVVVRDGTLKVGDVVVAGCIAGRIRAMFDSRGNRISEAGPSMPVEVVGLEALPEAGDLIEVMPDEKTARQITSIRSDRRRHVEARPTVSLESLYEKMRAGEVKELNLIIKADVQGSTEALKKSLSEIGTDEIKPKIVHAAVGMITETDVNLAVASGAIIIGFNVRPDAKAAKLAKQEGVEIKLYSVIYDVIEDVKKAVAGLLEPEYREEILGRLEVRQIFKVPKVGTIAGSYVKEGKVVRGARARLIREGKVIFETRIASLKRFKDDVKEVVQGYECGVGLENYQDIKVEDEIEIYEIREIKPTL